MPNNIPTASEKTISDWVGPRNFQLGRSYFESEAVIDPCRQGNAVKGWCQGSMPQPYRLHVAFGDNGIHESHCSCPVGAGGRCKHVGALLVAWLERPNAFREAAELEAGLKQLSKSELITLIKQVLQLQPDLESLLEMALQGGNRGDAQVNLEIYRRQVYSAFQRGGDDWIAPARVAREIGIILGAGDGLLAEADFAGASTVYRTVARSILDHYQMLPDEDGQLGEVVDRCVEGLGNCLSGGIGDPEAKESCLQALFDIYQFDVNIGGVGLGEAAPDLILEHANDAEKDAIAGSVREAMPRGDSWGDVYHRREYGRFLLGLEMAHLDDDSFLDICREGGLLADLVDRLLTLGRLDEAISEAELVEDYDLLTLANIFREHGCAPRVEPLLVNRIETSRHDGLADWLKEQHRERGDLAEALSMAMRLLERRPHLSRYQEVRELSRGLGTWQELRPQLLDRWTAAAEYGVLTEVYLEEGEIDLALTSVQQRRPGFLYGVDQLIRVANVASETRPQAALDIYRQQAESLIEARGRENYQQACVHLSRVRDLYGQLSQELAWTGFIAGLRERYRRLPALNDEMDKAGL